MKIKLTYLPLEWMKRIMIAGALTLLFSVQSNAQFHHHPFPPPNWNDSLNGWLDSLPPWLDSTFIAWHDSLENFPHPPFGHDSIGHFPPPPFFHDSFPPPPPHDSGFGGHDSFPPPPPHDSGFWGHDSFPPFHWGDSLPPINWDSMPPFHWGDSIPPFWHDSLPPPPPHDSGFQWHDSGFNWNDSGFQWHDSGFSGNDSGHCGGWWHRLADTGNPAAAVSVAIYPNPVVESAIVHIANSSGNVVMRLFDSNGRMIAVKSYANGDFQLTKDNLGAGIYFYQISDGNTRVAEGKLIFQ